MNTSSLQNKKLLVLGGTSYMPYIKEYAEKERFIVYCAGGKHNEIMEKYSDKFFLVEASDPAKIKQLIIDEGIDGVVSLGNEHLIDVAITVSQELGLYFYIDRNNWINIQDKSMFKKHCCEFDIDVVKEFDAHEAIETQGKSIDYPVIVKPVDGSGSQGITICHNSDGLSDAITKAKSYSKTNRYLIEEYILAPEFIATYIINNGFPQIWMLGDRYMNRLQEGLGGISNCSIFPSIHAEQYINNVHSKMVNLLKRYGPQNGTFFVQGFVKNNRFVFFDPALRFCGTLDIIPYSKITGINPLHWMINHSLLGIMDKNNEIELMDWKLKGYVVLQLSLHVKPGTIKRIYGFDEVKKIPGVYKVVQLLSEGDVIDKPGTLQQVLARAYIISDNIDNAKKCIKSIYDSVEVVNDMNENMIMSFKPYAFN